MKKVLLVALAGVLVLSVSVPAQTISDVNATKNTKPIYVKFKAPPPPIYQYVPGEMVLKLKSNVRNATRDVVTNTIVTGKTSLDELHKKYGVTSLERQFPDCPGVMNALQPAEAMPPDLSCYYVMCFNRKYDLRVVQKEYGANEFVDRAELIGVHPVYESIPNDPYFGSDQWNFRNANDHDIDAADAWDFHTGAPTAIVGVLETGLQYTSRDLGGSSPYTDGNVWINDVEYQGMAGVDDDGNGFIDDWIGWDFVHGASPLWPGEDGNTPDNEPTDFNGHGTHVSGIMGAMTNNGIMVAGLAGGWRQNAGDPGNGIKLMAVRIGWSAPYLGQEVGYVRMDFAAQGIYYAVNNGAMAINCSWGSSNTAGLGAAVDYATAHGVLVIEAAGNDGDSFPDYLGTRADVLSVAATNNNDVKASFSDYGTWVDIAAPGVDILSTYSLHYNGNYVAWVSGTSQAAPHVTGAAAYLKSYADTLTRSQIVDLLLDYTDDIDAFNPAYAGLLGSGRLNLMSSLDAVGFPSVTVIQPNGGEVLYIGQVYTVLWDASDNVGIVSTTVDYSHDGGNNWVHLADLVGNPGEYDWTVTGPPSDQCRMRVTCYDAVGRAGDDMSDEDFCPPYKIASVLFAIAGDAVTPEVYALEQNHPNPFNPATEISFSLAEESDVRLEVYNIVGQKVATLVDARLPAGPHSVTWDGRDLGSGLYFYRIQTDDFIATRKMMMLK